MRKRTISLLADNVLWYFIYLFPLIIMLAMSIKASFVPDLTAFMTGNGFNILSSGLIYSCLDDLFGSAGILPLFSVGDNGVMLYMSYFVSCTLLHLAVDFILFIPRIAHKFMDKFTLNGDYL